MLDYLLVVPSIDLVHGGPSYTVPSLTRGLFEQNMHAGLFTMESVGQDASAEFPFPFITVPSLPSCLKKTLYSPLFRSRLRDVCQSENVRLLHSNGLWMPANHDTAFVARQLRIPLVTAPRGMLTQWSLKHSSWKKKLALALYQQRDLECTAMFHATSTDELHDIRRCGFRQPIAVVPNGVDIPPWQPKTPKKANEDRIVLFMSRVHPKKGLSKLINAWEQLSPRGWKCIIVGPDENGHRKQLKRLISEKRLTNRFEFFHFVSGDTKWNLLRNADIFVLPTESENFGVVVPEALAAGTPVLTTRGAPWSELATHDCGWWVDTDVDAITEGLKKAMGCTDAERTAMGMRGRKLVEMRYSWQKIAVDLSSAYSWLLGEGERPQCVHVEPAIDGKTTKIRVPEMGLPSVQSPTTPSAMPVIVQTSSSIDPRQGGVSYAVSNLAKMMWMNHNNIHLVTTTDLLSGGLQRPENNYPFPCIRVTSVRSSTLRVSFAPGFEQVLLNYCRDQHADILHNNGIWTLENHATAAVARRLNLPLVTSPHGMLTAWALKSRSWKKKLALRLYQQDDLKSTTMFHATAEEERQDIRRCGFTQPVAVVPNGVQIPPWQEKLPRIPQADRIVLFMSRVHPKKGLPKLIEAWHRLQPAAWKCVIVGPDENGHRKQLEQLLAEKRLQDRFTFIDFATGDTKWQLLRTCDVFVLPTESENFGVVVPEALAAGTPVLTTKGAPWSELVSHGCGWWVETHQDAITEGLRQAIGCSDDERTAMGRRGRQLVEDNYSWSKVASDMERAYMWLLGKEPKPDWVKLD